MRGECAVESNIVGEVVVPCYEPHDPHYIDDADAIDLLYDICPELVAEGDDPLLCCDADQVQAMHDSFQIPMSLGLARCPSCLHNWRIQFCQSTCSPRQAEFITVTNTTKTDDGRDKIVAVDYHVNSAYPDGLYESCKGVQGLSSGQYLLDLMCGGWASAGCNGKRWIDFLGTSIENNGQAPYQFNYHLHDANEVMVNGKRVTPMNVKTFRCSERPSLDSQPCSCTDCADTCRLRELPDEAKALPEDPQRFVVMEMSGTMFVGWFAFVMFAAAIVGYFTLDAFKRKRTRNRKCHALLS